MSKEQLLSLTLREKEVLTMLADGYTNREVGAILNISHRTVDSGKTSKRIQIYIENKRLKDNFVFYMFAYRCEAHRLNIMLKLEKLHIVDLVKFAIKHQLTSVNKHKSNAKH